MNKIVVPKENASDLDFKIVNILFENNDQVEADDVVIEIESSKALIEITTEWDGFFFTDREVDESISVNEVIALISDSKIEDLSSLRTKEPEDQKGGESRFTKTAQEFIKKRGLDEIEILSKFSEDQVISERDLLQFDRKYILPPKEKKELGWIFTKQGVSEKRVAIIGGGAAGFQVIDLIQSLNGYRVAHIYDDTLFKQHKFLAGVHIKGVIDFDQIAKDHRDLLFDEVVISVGNSIEFRRNVFVGLTSRGVGFANLVHHSVYIGSHVEMGSGNILFPNSHVGSGTKIGNNNFITAMVSIEHNNVMGSHCTFGPAVFTSGGVSIGDEVKFGTGVYVEPYVNIGDDCIIGSGSVITNDVPQHTSVTSNIKLNILDRSRS